ncbi:hypothetical protein ACWEPB_02585 [Kitasatospora cineracea]
MSAPEQQAAPVQPPADLHQRIDATIRPRMLIGLQDAELYDQPGRERIGEWADSITSWVMAEVEPELAALRQQLADAQAENARLRADLTEARGHAELFGRKLADALASQEEP